MRIYFSIDIVGLLCFTSRGMVVALLLGASWMLYEDEVNAAEEAKKAAPASSAAAPAKQAAASAPAAAKAPETPSRFNLYECQVKKIIARSARCAVNSPVHK